MVLSAGGRCVIAGEAEPDLLLSLIEKHRVTVAILVLAFLKAIMESRT
jgi:non-ribosomal peptide synthetase component E (peptide arylation enzyme)